MQPMHRIARIESVRVFYREAGDRSAPTVLLLHGSPSCSFQFRFMLPALSDHWHLIAPDMPSFGMTEVHSPTPYSYTFDSFAQTIYRFIETLQLDISAVYLHDYGAQVGFRLLTSGFIRPRAVIIQNSEAYYGTGWHDPMKGVERRLTMSIEESRVRLRESMLTKEATRREFLEDLPPEIASRIDPVAIELGWSKINDPTTIAARLELLMDYGSNIQRYSEVQACLRENRFPTLLLWGIADQYLSQEAAQAYRRDLPDAELCVLDGGHWLLESHIDDVNMAVRAFLAKHNV